MNWINLISEEQLNQLNEISTSKTVVFFKHSTRCSISSTALSRIERQIGNNYVDVDFVYLDLLNYRNLSNLLGQIYGVEHQSPQALVIKNKKCVANNSHLSIDIIEMLKVS
mgnify:FL=1